MKFDHTGRRRMPALTRRQFLELGALSAAGLAAGCAANPVTGESQLMLVSEEQETQIDRQNSPHQFSSDYGTVQDAELNRYLDRTGRDMAARTHRPQMPYSFRAVNATYVNAYAFPGGTIAVTRGILLELDNEAELAALMGHELGHVNARHTARQMSSSVLTQMLVGGLAVAAGTQGQVYGELASQLGMVGAGALLASYSRDNEREADALGLEYTVRSGYGPEGFQGLMEMLNRQSQHKAGAFEMLFATHPMSRERYRTAVAAVKGPYAAHAGKPLHRERYMDHTAGLRRREGAIREIQAAEKLMGEGNLREAEGRLRVALVKAPGDYTGLVLMSKCLLAQKRPAEARRYADQAKAVYPDEAQARHLAGFAGLQEKRYAAALEDFKVYDRLLPGNPTMAFFQGYALEGMQRRQESAQAYYRYLQQVNQGQQARYAYGRLKSWGYLK